MAFRDHQPIPAVHAAQVHRQRAPVPRAHRSRRVDAGHRTTSARRPRCPRPRPACALPAQVSRPGARPSCASQPPLRSLIIRPIRMGTSPADAAPAGDRSARFRPQTTELLWHSSPPSHRRHHHRTAAAVVLRADRLALRYAARFRPSRRRRRFTPPQLLPPSSSSTHQSTSTTYPLREPSGRSPPTAAYSAAHRPPLPLERRPPPLPLLPLHAEQPHASHRSEGFWPNVYFNNTGIKWKFSME